MTISTIQWLGIGGAVATIGYLVWRKTHEGQAVSASEPAPAPASAPVSPPIGPIGMPSPFSTTPAPTEAPTDLGGGVSAPASFDLNTISGVQGALRALEYDIGPPGVDGTYNAYTKAAVKRFQVASKLTPDGVVGGDTRAKLSDALSARSLGSSYAYGGPAIRGVSLHYAPYYR